MKIFFLGSQFRDTVVSYLDPKTKIYSSPAVWNEEIENSPFFGRVENEENSPFMVSKSNHRILWFQSRDWALVFTTHELTAVPVNLLDNCSMPEPPC